LSIIVCTFFALAQEKIETVPPINNAQAVDNSLDKLLDKPGTSCEQARDKPAKLVDKALDKRVDILSTACR